MSSRVQARFLISGTAPGLRGGALPSGHSLELAPGERLLDAVDDQHALGLLPTACRAGNCGMCLVRVREGAGWLEPPAAEEREALSELGCAADQRLGCQVHVCAALPTQNGPFQVIFERLPR